MKHKILELVFFNGRNGFRPIDRIRRTIATALSVSEFEFYSLSNLLNPLEDGKNHKIKYITNRNLYHKFALGMRILATSFIKKYDILHSIIEPFTLQVLNFTKLRNTDISHLFTLHSLPFKGCTFDGKKILPSEREIYLRNLTAKIIKTADCISAVSKTNCREVEEEYSVECKLMLDGVDTEFFKPKAKANDRKFRILYLGSFQKRKNVLTAIDIAKNYPDIEMKVIGRGYSANELIAASKKYKNLNVSQEFLSVNQLYNEYTDASVFLFPSLHEGLANVLLEAISCGLPVLAANYTSNPELVKEGLNGYLFNNTKEMIEKVELLINSSNLQKMGEESRKIALEYDWSKVVGMHYELFKSLIETI